MLEKLKRRLDLPEGTDGALLGDLLDAACAFIQAYTGRTVLPAALESAAVELAAAAYHQRGLEGLSAHAEGGVSASINQLPPRMRAQLDMFRLGKVL